MGLRKNELATVDPNMCDNGTVDAWRALNEAELEAWRNSDASKGIDCAGETKLPPRRKYFHLEAGQVVTVLKGRTAWHGDWGHPVRNMALIMTAHGEVLYARRKHLIAA